MTQARVLLISYRHHILSSMLELFQSHVHSHHCCFTLDRFVMEDDMRCALVQLDQHFRTHTYDLTLSPLNLAPLVKKKYRGLSVAYVSSFDAAGIDPDDCDGVINLLYLRNPTDGFVRRVSDYLRRLHS